MYAAAAGKVKGVPKSVGREFVKAANKKGLPERIGKKKAKGKRK